MGFINRIINTLVRPKKAIENILSMPLIEEAVMIVGIYAILSAAVSYIRSTKIKIITQGATQLNPELASTFSIIIPIIFAFITWFILTGIIHTISIAAGGKGKFYPQMIVLVGFAMLPLIFGSIISALIISTAGASTVTISLENPLTTQQAIRDLQNRTPFLVSTIINSVAWIWSLAIIYLGLQTIQKLSKGKALITIAIPLFLILLMIYGPYGLR